jgi:HEAT repeats
MTSRISVRIVTAFTIGLASKPLATPLAAQSLASRVIASEGMVQVIYPSRPNACGDGVGSISNVFGETRMYSGRATWSGRNGWTMRQCVHGPARLVVTVVASEVTRVRAYVGPIPPTPTDVRTISASAAEAITWTSDLVANGNARLASEMILPLILADGPEPWPALLKVARDDNRPRELRRSVMMWLSTGVSDHLGIGDADGGASDDDEMRNQAIYVLTQRPKAEGVPQLIEIARSSKHPSARKTAIYWLGQSGDPRAVDVYAELLGLR